MISGTGLANSLTAFSLIAFRLGQGFLDPSHHLNDLLGAKSWKDRQGEALLGGEF